jgi:hypothetical protein
MASAASEGLITLILQKVGRVFCLHQNWMLMRIGRPSPRMWLRCQDCGAETQGFTVGKESVH